MSNRSAASPAALPLFYRSVVPLDRGRHRALAVPAVPSYGFAASSHLLPAVVDEFASACASLPILFVPDAEGVSPIFLVGTTPGRNGFVAVDGSWTGPYVPAFLRRYPMILGEVPDGEPLLCIDEQADGLCQAEEADTAANGSGTTGGARETTVALFQADGAETPALTERGRLAADYAAAARRTQLFCRLLVALKLLQPITVQRAATNATAEAAASGSIIHGLLAVSEPSLAALAEADFLRLRAEGHLGALYTHLVSLRAIERLPG